jgi:hypothetical protein
MTDSAAKIAKYIVDKEDGLRWGAYLGGLGVIALFWWAGSLWRTMRRGEDGVPRLAVFALAGLIFASVMATVSTIVLSAIATLGIAGSGGPDGTKFFYVLGWLFNGAAMFGIAAFLAAAGVLVVRSGVLPRALGWLGVLLAIVAAVGGASVATTDDAVFTVTFVAFIGFLLWVLVASVFMLRARPTGDVEVIVVAEVSAA